MKYCSKCGKPLSDEVSYCPYCGNNVGSTYSPSYSSHYEEDEVSGGLCLLSVLIPLFGIIYWAIKHKDTPKKAKACGVAAIVSWIVCFIIGIISYVGMYNYYLDLFSSMYSYY